MNIFCTAPDKAIFHQTFRNERKEENEHVNEINSLVAST